jgi:hypothetical protein
MAEVFTTGYLRRARDAGTGVRTAGFVLQIINWAGSEGSASIPAVRALSIFR